MTTYENRIQFDDFCGMILELVRDHLDGEEQFRLRHVTRTNGGRRTGLMISEEGIAASPTFYLEQPYERFLGGDSMEEIALDLAEEYRIHRLDFAEMPRELTERKRFLGALRLKVVNAGRNRDLLKLMTVRRSFDLAAVPYLELNNPQAPYAMMPVRFEQLLGFGLETEEVFERARDNTMKEDPFFLASVYELLKEMQKDFTGEEPEEEERTAEGIPMYVLSRKSGMYGAAALFFPETLKQTVEQIGKSCFILPSSIHELIIVPDEGAFEAEDLRKNVQEINASCVPFSDVLSDHVYYYELPKGRLRDLTEEESPDELSGEQSEYVMRE